MNGIFSFIFSIFASEYKLYIIAAIIAFIVIISVILFFVFRKDHFSNINGFQIKYNSNDVVKPNQLSNELSNESQETKNSKLKNELQETINSKLSNECETNKLQEAINSELSSQPLSWDNQMYSFDKYPFVGSKQYCNNNNDCSQISAKCKNNECILKNTDTTVFNVKY